MNYKSFYLFLMVTFLLDARQLDLNHTDYIGNTFKVLESTTPEQEYILGKKIAARSISDEIYYSKSTKVKYLNSIVNSLILSSDRPYIYDGYKVILVKNKSFNAYAYPGGIIVVNDGIFKHLINEDQLAAILAHEIGHIQEKHNVNSEKSYKLEDAMHIASILGVGKHVDNKYAKMLSFGVFKGVSDSIINGYGVNQEAEADALGVSLMIKAGYDPIESINTLKKLNTLTNSYGGSNYPEDRLKRIEVLIEKSKYDKTLVLKTKNNRTKRYKKYR